MSKEKVILENMPCPNGCRAGDQIMFSAGDRLHGLPGEFDVVRCKECGLIRTNPRPTPESIGAYYPADYGPYLGTKISETPNKFRNLFRFFYKYIFSTNSQKIPPVVVGRALEIGSASGAFLAYLARAGWIVEGIEFSADAAESSREAGFSVHVGSVENAPSYDALFDIVIGWMVLEHLHDPLRALTKLASWTKPGGYLVISVPNAGSMDFSIFQDAGYALQVPTHLYHYTPDTLKQILQSSGWRIERIFHHRTLANWLGSLGNALEDRGVPDWVFGPLKRYPQYFGLITLMLYPLAYIFALFGQTGRMTVWARRD